VKCDSGAEQSETALPCMEKLILNLFKKCYI
jgi:hypothetical protein